MPGFDVAIAGHRQGRPAQDGTPRPGGAPARLAGWRCGRIGLVAGVFAALACAGTAGPPVARGGDARAAVAREIRMTIIHLNDLYEITPTAGGRLGGPARVATVRRRLAAANPNTIVVLAGDVLSPSALATARLDGQRIDGRQMVATLNALGLDYATFGNHEFDLAEDAFFARLRESRFRWLSANVRAVDGTMLPSTATHAILRFGTESGDTVRVALFGLTMDRDQSEYAPVGDPLAAAGRAVRTLRDSAEILIALTHLPLAQDVALAENWPEIDLVVGGHEHENLLVHRGDDLTPIAKADANVRTVYVHELSWRFDPPGLSVTSRLVPVTDSIPDDPATLAVVDEWVRLAFAGFRESGFDPAATIAETSVPLDGLRSSVRVDTTTLTQTIARAMAAEAPNTVAAIYNAGSIRIDDVLPPGPVTQYDVIRVLPFGGTVVEVQMTGALLLRVLAQGARNAGTGGFLHHAGIGAASGRWTIAGSPIEEGRVYRIAVSDFLLSGREQGLDFLVRDSPDVRVLAEHRDVRHALIDELSRRYPRR